MTNTFQNSIFIKILISATQVNVLALSFSFDFGALMESILGASGEVATIGTAYLEFGCLTNGNAFFVDPVVELGGRGCSTIRWDVAVSGRLLGGELHVLLRECHRS